jgi:hypothetical protein
MASRDELLDQIPSLKKKYIKYVDYSDATVESIFGQKSVSEAKVLRCTETESVVLLQEAGLKFSRKSLPVEAQFSTTQSILARDVDDDGKMDLVLLGNFFPYRTQMGESDSSYGLVLLGNGGGTFSAVPPFESGLWAGGDVRKGLFFRGRDSLRLVISRNNDSPLVISLKKP